MCNARERAEQYGPTALTDNELLNVIFGSKYEKNYGDICNMTVPELIAGGYSRSEAIKAVSLLEYTSRLTRKSIRNEAMTSPERIAAYCNDMQHFDKEHFRVLFLNARCRIVNSIDITVGTENASLVSVREVLTMSLRHGTGNIAVVHNHPSGDPEPSNEDIQVTRTLNDGCRAVGVRLLDHLIIADGGCWYSFKERGNL